MLLELHCHTSAHSSCSHLDPLDAVARARAKGLQGLVITEHHYQWSEEELRQLAQEAGLDETFVLLSGQEVETEVGHVLVFGADRTISDRTRLSELRRRWPGAALIWAHPFRRDKIPADEALQNPLLDGVELFNSNHSPRGNYFALRAWHRLKFVATAGSDSHGPETVGMFPTLLDHPVCTTQLLAGELRHGRCRPFLKEIPRAGSNLTVTDITIGTKGDNEQRQRLVVKHPRNASKWRQQQRATAAVQALLDSGFCCETFRVPRILEVNEPERLVIEEGQRGKLLFDLLRTVSPEVADTYFELSARWLASMHSLGLRGDSAETTIKRERRRFDSYLDSFRRTGSPHLALAEQAMEAVREREEALFSGDQARFVLSHGDYHPKNIIIGQDRGQDISTVYVSVIDFASAMPFVAAFDVGYFRAQLRHQLREHPDVLERQSPDAFQRAYTEASPPPAGFADEVRLFEARASMSIASFLIKVGKGESPEMAALMDRTAALLHLPR